MIAILGMVVLAGVIWMILTTSDIAPTTEGFSNKSNLHENIGNYGYINNNNNNGKELFSNTNNRKKSKLSKLMLGKHSKSRNNPTYYRYKYNSNGNKKGNNKGANNGKNKDKEEYMNVLKFLSDDDDEDEGKYDNFQDVLDEIDKIDVGAFSINSIGNTIQRYSKNFDKRLKYAHKKNSKSNVDASMAQLSVITDEFRKLFAIDKLI